MGKVASPSNTAGDSREVFESIMSDTFSHFLVSPVHIVVHDLDVIPGG